jgi:hypothetical protein
LQNQKPLWIYSEERLHILSIIQCFSIWNYLKIQTHELDQEINYMKINDERNFDSKTPEEKYEFLKQLQGELKAFYLKLRAKLNSEGN